MTCGNVEMYQRDVECTEQDVNNQTLTKISQFYVDIAFCLKAF